MAKEIAIQAPMDRRLSRAVSIMAADNLVLQQHKVSTAVILIQLSRDILTMREILQLKLPRLWNFNLSHPNVD